MRRTIAAIGALVLVAAIQGCAQLDHFPPPRGGPRTCNGSTCQIDIITKACSAGACWDLAADDREVHVSHAQHVHLVWTAPSGYGFCAGTTDGIAFGETRGQMTDGYPSANGTSNGGSGQHPKFHWKDANTALGKFPYTIRFHAQGDCGGKPVELDPVIINDM